MRKNRIKSAKRYAKCLTDDEIRAKKRASRDALVAMHSMSASQNGNEIQFIDMPEEPHYNDEQNVSPLPFKRK